eukprot:657047-Prymnesium_polylepis.1
MHIVDVLDVGAHSRRPFAERRAEAHGTKLLVAQGGFCLATAAARGSQTSRYIEDASPQTC